MTTFNRQTKYSKVLPEERLPSWIKPGIGKASQLEKVQKLVKRNRLHTICEEGRCPNRSECYASGTASFLLGGSICTRSCAFCQVEKGKSPQEVDVNEAKRVAQAIQQLKLNYVVLTAVARDDLHDHGASIFTETIVAIRELVPNINIEVLTPDFWGGSSNEDTALRLQKERLAKVLSAKPVCFNHNLETVERLQKRSQKRCNLQAIFRFIKNSKRISSKDSYKVRFNAWSW